MTWKGIDFQGIVTLDQGLIDELRFYLLEKESQLGKILLDTIEAAPPASQPSLYFPPIMITRPLLDSTELFAKGVRSFAKNKQLQKPKDAWKNTSNLINAALWDYVEILEGCITELFQQLNHVGFEVWRPDLVVVVETVHEILLQKIRELYRVIDLLKTSLREYRYICQGRKRWFSINLSCWPLIDSSIITSLNKCEKTLIREKEKFISRYHAFTAINQQADDALKKFSQFVLLNKLDEGIQNDIKRIYKLLKIWKLNQKTKALSEREPIRVMRSGFSIEKATQLFKFYYLFLRTTLYERSKILKMGPRGLFEEEGSKKLILDTVNGYRAEVHTLGATVAQFREYFLDTNPDPYVRSRWGFPEWIVGPEPHQTKELQDLVFKLERLDKLYSEISLAIHRGYQPGESFQLSKQYREVLRLLHEMGQPLTSRAFMKSRSEKILTLLQEMNELGSFNPEVIDYVGKVLSKAMRVDWQYHVLFEFTKFHHLYEIHRGLIGSLDNRLHLNRLNKFKKIVKKLQEWVANRDTGKHVHEIEMEMSDLRLYLQEFLANVQRELISAEQHPEAFRKIKLENSSQLLEYRYLFGNFFHFLHQNEPEGKTIRNQFLFVDQYFETVENHLHDVA